MHIPDSVLSPATSAVGYAAMLPVWAVAARRVRARLQTRQVSLLALGAAFCFTVMLFNIPALGGTTAHPVAGTLLAVLLGPWAAVLGVSVALAIQALFFGDGGILTFGANCFTMAFALPFVGYSVYALLAGRSASVAPRRALCAGVGAYVGLNAGAALVGLLLGLQPVLFHEPNGHALYFPFGLAITLPAMLGTHLLIAGPAEAIVTTLVVRYLQAARLPLYGVEMEPDSSRVIAATQDGETAPEMTIGRWQRAEPLWIGLFALVALSPLGLLAKGEAWGEWDSAGLRAEIARVEGANRAYTPQGVARQEATAYKALPALSDYASDRGWKGYLSAGVLGIGVISGLTLAGGRALTLRERRDDEEGGDNDDPAPPTGSGRNLRNEGRPPLRSNGPISNAASSDRPPEIASPDESSSVASPGKSPLPEWLARPSDPEAPPANPPAGPTNQFLERTLAGLTANASRTLQSERAARLPGLLQGRDARAKLVTMLGGLTLIASLRHFLPLALCYALIVALAGASRLDVGAWARRVWLSVPIFVGALALPAALNVVTPGPALLTLWTRPFVAITTPGLALAALLTFRVGAAVSLASLIALTTPWNDLLRALQALFIPRLFLHILAMTYRYLLTLLQAATDQFTARRCRTVGPTTNRQGRQFIGASLGALFGKTLALSEAVHGAMLARGYRGEPHSLTRFRWRTGDTLWLAASVLIGIMVWTGR